MVYCVHMSHGLGVVTIFEVRGRLHGRVVRLAAWPLSIVLQARNDKKLFRPTLNIVRANIIILLL